MNKIIILCLLLVACKNKDCRYITGVWAINEMKVKDKDFKKFLNVNTFGFDCDNNTGWFQGSYFFDGDENIKWFLIKNENATIDSIRIKSKIKIYNDTFSVKLNVVDSTGQTYIELKSKKVYILANKILEASK